MGRTTNNVCDLHVIWVYRYPDHMQIPNFAAAVGYSCGLQLGTLIVARQLSIILAPPGPR